jgi:N-acetylglucosaminyl-diphospho-decaprenol L-rhamnosyltransferase
MSAEVPQTITVSIVSHGHGEMVNTLVHQLLLLPEVGQIILTRNIPEGTPVVQDARVHYIENTNPKGFGANHNAAFALCHLPFYCVLNPDIILQGNPFPQLLDCVANNSVDLCAPRVVAPNGQLEDSVRHFPTLRSLVRKVLSGDDGRYQVQLNQQAFAVDWVAGMFMLFNADGFRAVGGFDEKYFLYYEDVDICARLWRTGRSVSVCPSVQVIHDAQRASRINSRHMRWHAASMLRYFLKHWWRLPRKLVN